MPYYLRAWPHFRCELAPIFSFFALRVFLAEYPTATCALFFFAARLGASARFYPPFFLPFLFSRACSKLFGKGASTFAGFFEHFCVGASAHAWLTLILAL